MPLKMRTEASSLRRTRDRHRHTLDRVVRVALQVPRRVERLGVARGVRGTRAEHVLALRRVPDETPAAPGSRAEVRLEHGVGKGGAAVGGDLDAFNRPPPRPGPATQLDGTGLEATLAGEEVRNPRRDH